MSTAEIMGNIVNIMETCLLITGRIDVITKRMGIQSQRIEALENRAREHERDHEKAVERSITIERLNQRGCNP